MQNKAIDWYYTGKINKPYEDDRTAVKRLTREEEAEALDWAEKLEGGWLEEISKYEAMNTAQLLACCVAFYSFSLKLSALYKKRTGQNLFL